MAIAQAVRVRREETFELRVGAQADLMCRGVVPSWLLRHPLFVRWL
jgi:hypothetical protein